MRTTPIERTAAAFLLLEGSAVVGLSVWELLALVTGDTASIASAVALLVLTLIGAAAVLAFGVSVARGISWGRSGGVVTQLLILSVAGGSLTGEGAKPEIALLLAAPAVIGLVLLIAASRAAGRRARAEEAALDADADADAE